MQSAAIYTFSKRTDGRYFQFVILFLRVKKEADVRSEESPFYFRPVTPDHLISIRPNEARKEKENGTYV